MLLRWYQSEAVDAAYSHLCSEDGNPVICMPTGSGKSIVIAELARRAIQQFDGRVLVLQHRKELIEQNAAKLRSIMPELDIGIYSAGLSSRDTDHRVVFAGIQSIYNKVHLLAPRQLGKRSLRRGSDCTIPAPPHTNQHLFHFQCTAESQ